MYNNNFNNQRMNMGGFNPMYGQQQGGFGYPQFNPNNNFGVHNIMNKKKVNINLSEDEQKELLQSRKTEVLTRLDVLKAKCTHTDRNGNFAFNIGEDNKCKCNICGEGFQIKTYKKEELQAIVDEVINAIQCIKVSNTENNPLLSHLYEYSSILQVIPSLTVNSVDKFIKSLTSGTAIYNSSIGSNYNNILNGVGSYNAAAMGMNPMMGGQPMGMQPQMGGMMNPMMAQQPQTKFYYDPQGLIYALDNMGGFNQVNLQPQQNPQDGKVYVMFNGMAHVCEPYGTNQMMGMQPQMGGVAMGQMGAHPFMGQPQPATQQPVPQAQPAANPAVSETITTIDGKKYKVDSNGVATPVQ